MATSGKGGVSPAAMASTTSSEPGRLIKAWRITKFLLYQNEFTRFGYLFNAHQQAISHCCCCCRGIARDVLVFGFSIIGIRVVLAMMAEEGGAGGGPSPLPGIPS